jgi:hypothetical protein
MKTSAKKLFNMYKASQRETAICAGFYDGRFKNRVEVPKKHKPVKHKKKLFE